MLVKLNTTMAGPKLTATSGSVVDVDEVQGKALIEGGYAEAVVEEKAKKAKPVVEEVETAEAVQASEHAVGRGSKRKN